MAAGWWQNGDDKMEYFIKLNTNNELKIEETRN